MKKFFTLLAAGAGLAILTPVTSEARDHHHGRSSSSYSHRCNSCSAPVYRERAIVGRDRCGQPIYGWRTASHGCRVSHSSKHHHSGSHHSHMSSHGSRYHR